MTAFIAAVLGHISESSSQINENQAEDWALCLSMQQCRSNSLLDAHQGAMPSPSHFQLSSLLLPLRLCRLCPLGSSHSFLIYGLPILPLHGYRTYQPLPTAQLSPLMLLVLTAQGATSPAFPRTLLSWGDKPHYHIQTPSSQTQHLSVPIPSQPAQRGTAACFSKLGVHRRQCWQPSHSLRH